MTPFDVTLDGMMTSDVVTVQIGDEAEYAALQMSSFNVPYVLACNGKVPTGMITEKLRTHRSSAGRVRTASSDHPRKRRPMQASPWIGPRLMTLC